MPNRPYPFFSVIIPSHLQHDRLAACLRALERCAYPHDRFEVIVVDEASGAAPRAVLAVFSGKIDLAMIELSIAGTARARNAGARHARGEYLVFIDEDCAATSDWLHSIAKGVESMPGAAITGRTVNALPRKLTSEASQAMLDYRSLHFKRDARLAGIYSSSNLATTVSAYRELGGFDETIPLAQGSAWDFVDRWVSSGRQLVYLEDAVLLDAHTPTLGSFLREHYDQGRAARHLDRRHTKQGEGRLSTDQPRVRELMMYPFERRSGWRAPFLSVLMLVAQVTRSIGYFVGR